MSRANGSTFGTTSLLTLALAAAGCKGGARAPTSSMACTGVAHAAEPLVVDWKAPQRTDLELAMESGVPVVAYDCGSLRVLRGCKLDGSYGFVAMRAVEEPIKLDSSVEVSVNLPTAGLSLIQSIGADVERDSSLDLATIVVGRRRTTLRGPARDALLGGDACAGATHYVRGASVGAFALAKRAKSATALTIGELFTSTTDSTRSSEVRDGDRDACAKVDEQTTEPPANCSALVRLELQSLDAPAADAQASAASACPPGLVFSGGKCMRAESAVAYACDPSAAGDCTRQCARGDVGSCVLNGDRYVEMFTTSHDVRDRDAAARLYERACDAGSPQGCDRRGNMYLVGTRNEAAALKLFDRGCSLGYGVACGDFAAMLQSGEGGPADPVRALAIFKRACDGGHPLSCTSAGNAYSEGVGVPADIKTALTFFKRACDGLEGHGCTRMAQSLQKSDPEAARRAAHRGAGTGDPFATYYYGMLVHHGVGAPEDHAAAAKLFETACGEKSASSGDRQIGQACDELGEDYKEGDGEARDVAHAAALFELACSLKAGGGCNHLGLLTLAQADGRPDAVQRAAHLYDTACKLGLMSGCGNLAELEERSHVKVPGQPNAVGLYRLACKGGDDWSCDQLERLHTGP